jgi:hypothetical protein
MMDPVLSVPAKSDFNEGVMAQRESIGATSAVR